MLGVCSLTGATGHVGKVESDVPGLWDAPALAHTVFSGMGRSTLVLFTCVYFEAHTLLAWVRWNWFLAPLDTGLTSSMGPTWGVGDVISSEGCCMVGQSHSCSEVKPEGWWGPKRHWITQGPGYGQDACMSFSA